MENSRNTFLIFITETPQTENQIHLGVGKDIALSSL